MISICKLRRDNFTISAYSLNYWK